MLCPDAHFKIDGYQFLLFKKDRNAKGGCKIVFIRHGLIATRLEIFEIKTAEKICIELIFSQRKWCILFIYKPPKITKSLFFEEVSKTLSQALNKYDNILIAGDFNIDI